MMASVGSRVVLGVVVAAGALVLGACASPGGEDVVASESGSLAGDAQSYARDAWQATEDYVAQCMHDQGFDYTPRPFKSREIAIATLTPYTLTMEEARSRGFGFVDEELGVVQESQQTASEVPVVVAEPEDQYYQDALYGDGTGTTGCQAEAAEHALEGFDLDDYPTLVERTEVVDKIIADPRLSSFWATWSSCMADRGIRAIDLDSLKFDYSDRAAKLVRMSDPMIDQSTGVFIPPQASIDETEADQLRAEEIKAATASVECLDPLHDQWDEILASAEG